MAKEQKYNNIINVDCAVTKNGKVYCKLTDTKFSTKKTKLIDNVLISSPDRMEYRLGWFETSFDNPKKCVIKKGIHKEEAMWCN